MKARTKVYNLNDNINDQKKKWYKHVLRMDKEWLSVVPLNYKLKGYRYEERPKHGGM
jgi:hypothetical protein